MESRAYAITVGIFTLMLGVGLVLAYFWINGSQQVLTEYTITSSLPVTGLNTEAAVKFRGVDVGKVKEISLDPSSQTTIRIRIAVAQNLKLSSESYAQLHLQGLTGIAYVDLNDEGKNTSSSSASELPAGGTIPLRPSFMDQLTTKGPELISQLEVLLQNSSQLTASANQVLTSIDTQKLNHTIANLDKASEQALPAINSATTMFNNVSKVTSSENRALLVQTFASIKQTSDAEKPLISELTQTAKNFRNTTDQIELSTKQLINTVDNETLPQLHTLTQSMNRSVNHFDQLIDVLEDNPQSIILGKPAPPPGPGEAGFTIKP